MSLYSSLGNVFTFNVCIKSTTSMPRFKIKMKWAGVVNEFNGSQLAKLKRVFRSCYCHEIYTVEVLCPKNYNYAWKIAIFVNMGNLLRKRYFANNFLIKVQISEFSFTHVTYIILKILHAANFVSIKLIFSLIQISLPNFAGFSRVKSTSVT